ncbi:transcription repressor OFP8-like [Salvia hispanica]|uniref:transcription repressor OFP8-like n=1 Tax=Salvia hispanica TaxID=49212 RepID=UPI00200969B7|nr:transcription repressor OFP8-like [Salvia hispanica]
MATSKTLKLHFSLQLCRPKNPFSMIKVPNPPHTPPYILSPLNSKTFDISFPATPIPPPTSSDDDELDWWVPSSRNDKTKKHRNTKQHEPKSLSSQSGHEEERGKLHKPPRRRFKRYGSKEWKEGEECSERKPMLERPAEQCMVSDHGRSFMVVVKKSVDPYEDFKKSMSEMMVAEKILEPREMEQLLMSFLSLNSRMHHKVIIQAFTQIFKEML